MANYSTLKAAIDQYITANGNKEITGTVLNDVLVGMVESLGAYYQYRGVATPETVPNAPDENVFYLAFEAGTYSNFSAIVVTKGVTILKWNGTWQADVLFTFDGIVSDGSISENKIADGAVTTSKIAEGAVTTSKIADAAVTTAKLYALSVTADKIAQAAITMSKLASGSVTLGKLSFHSLNISELPAIGTGVGLSEEEFLAIVGTLSTFKTSLSNQYFPLFIYNGKTYFGFGYNSGTEFEIYTIIDGKKLSLTFNYDGSNFSFMTLTYDDNIADLGVTNAKLATSAVTTSKIAELAVTNAKLASNAVTESKIADESVTLAKIDPSIIDATPTSNSNNLVKSGGVRTALTNLENGLTIPIFDDSNTHSEIIAKYTERENSTFMLFYNEGTYYVLSAVDSGDGNKFYFSNATNNGVEVWSISENDTWEYSSVSFSNFVSILSQTLTDTQKAQARENIDAISESDDAIQYMAKLLVQQQKEIDGIKANIESLKPANATEYLTNNTPNTLYSETAGAPSSSVTPSNWNEETMGLWTGVPRFIGQTYIDKANGKVYVAKAVTNSTSDWVLLN